MKCPLCDYKLELKKIKNEGVLPSGNKFYFDDKIYHCTNCKFEQSVGTESKSYLVSKKNAMHSTVKGIVTNLQEKFQNLLYIERTLDLPRRTLSRWKHSGEGSASTLLLLKMLETFPFLIDVAEQKFDPVFAEKALVDAVKNSKVSNSWEEYHIDIKPARERASGVVHIISLEADGEGVVEPVVNYKTQVVRYST